MAVLTGLVIGALGVPLKQVTFGPTSTGLIAVGILISLLLSKFADK